MNTTYRVIEGGKKVNTRIPTCRDLKEAEQSATDFFTQCGFKRPYAAKIRKYKGRTFFHNIAVGSNEEFIYVAKIIEQN